MLKILKKQNLIIIICGIIFVFSTTFILAEQSGSSPDSGTNSRILDVYSGLVESGFGNEQATSLGDLGSMWNRIASSSLWIPDTGITTKDVYPGITFYNGSRELKTGDAAIGKYVEQGLQDYNDTRCAGNNGEENTECAGGDSEYIGEEQTWIKTAYGGSPASVTDNNVTITITSNSVYRDELTRLYWSDITSSGLDAEAMFTDGQEIINPTGSICNFASDGVANAYCDNQDVMANGTNDNDVSAAEFCLNLELDADNADEDNNGLTGVESDWRLPHSYEALQAYIDGAFNNLPNATTVMYFYDWYYIAFSMDFFGYDFSNNARARCVRTD